MKKLYAHALLLVLFLGGCYCDDPDPYFDIQGIDIYNRSAYSSSTKDSIRYQDFAIDIYFKARFYSQAEQPNFSFIPAAMASQPCEEPGYKGTKERIEKIELFALSDFNANYKKDALLNPVLTINGYPEAEFFKEQDQFGLGGYGLHLQLTQKPDSTVKQAFKVNIKLTNGEEYTGQTELVTIF